MDNDKPSRLYLIRHGETVDNVKGLYAGVRDSVLTVHGVQQIHKLGEWLAQNKPPLTHVFSSDLIRASKTAEAICAAQLSRELPTPIKLSVLQEQNFGLLEGQPWTSKKRVDSVVRQDTSERGPEGIIAESKDALATRADTFICTRLLPLLQTHLATQEVHVAVVSHGMMLSALWKQILRKQAPGTVGVQEELLERLQPNALEHLGGWSNTGFLELEVRAQSLSEIGGLYTERSEKSLEAKRGLGLRVAAVDHRAHLGGLKRSRGGIGSSAHDDQQSSIKSFFSKKPRHG